MTSWLDRVMAVPAVGLNYRAWFRSRDAVLASLEELFAKWDREGQQLAFVERGPFGLHVEAQTLGVTIDFDLQNLTATSKAFVELKEDVQGRHHETSQEAKPYTELMEQLEGVLSEVGKHMLGELKRPLVRAGVVAECRVPREAAPPGIEAWMESLGASWGGNLLGGQANFLVGLEARDGSKDRCLHRIQFAEDAKFVDVRLDWQRHFDPPLATNGRDVARRLPEWREAALAYFEQLAIGLGPEEAKA